MKYARTSKRKIIQAVKEAILSKLENNLGNSTTINVKRVINAIGLNNHVVRTNVGKTLARLEELGYLKKHNNGKPAKYVVTKRGLRWVKKRKRA